MVTGPEAADPLSRPHPARARRAGRRAAARRRAGRGGFKMALV
jgi:hypothetical protein